MPSINHHSHLIMKKYELVFIPAPGPGHVVATVQIAKLLVERDDRVSITIIVMNLPHEATTYVDTLSASTLSSPINFIQLSNHSLPKLNPRKVFDSFIEFQKPRVKEAVSNLTHSLSASPDSPRLACFVLDMFCTTMIDIANDFGVPSYVFFTSGAAFLGLVFHTQLLYDEQNKPINEFKGLDTELEIPSLVNAFPVRFLPSLFLDKEWVMLFCEQARRFRTVKGIVVNSFLELETYAFKSFSDEHGKFGRIPPVYSVGPLLNLKGDNYDVGLDGSMTKSEIMEWLDDQPASSVVFLCFGSRGSFDEDQVREIACALEQSGYRFLWSLRQPPAKDKLALPADYLNTRNVLPEGFLDRTAKIGKVIGWAPQVCVLGHKAIGGFVSHCGWNSILESVWYGVPFATWPIYGEQQFNAFQMVKEVGLAAEIKMDYRNTRLDENPVLVTAGEIERGIRKLMEEDGEIRKRSKEMSEKSRRALMDGGSSFSSLGCFIHDLIDNIS